MAEMPPEIRARHDERMMWVGWVCSQWSYLEYIVFRCLRKMLDVDDITAKIMIGGTDLKPRLIMATELAKHQRRPAVAAALREVTEAIDKSLTKRRNRAVHGVQFIYATGEMMVELHRGRDRARRPMSEKDLKTLSEEIRVLSGNLNDRLNPLLWGRKSPPWSLLEKPKRQSRQKSRPTQGQKPKPREPLPQA